MIWRILITACVMSAAALSSTMSYTGELIDANDIVLEQFVISNVADVAIQTWGYGGTAAAPGGTNAAGTVIQPSGFDPLVTLFGPDGGFIDYNDDGSCPPGTPDAGNCFDSTLEIMALGPGVYTVALSAVANFPIGPTLQDGFTGTGDFSNRSTDYAFDLTVISEGTDVPEPGEACLSLTGLVLCSWKAMSLRNKRGRDD